MVFGRSKGSIQTSVIVEQPPTTAAEEEEPPILGGLSIQHSGGRLQQSYNVGTGGSSIDGGDKNSGGESLRIIGNHDADDEETGENRPNSAGAITNMSTSFRKKVSTVRETIHHDNSKQKMIRYVELCLAAASLICWMTITGRKNFIVDVVTVSNFYFIPLSMDHGSSFAFFLSRPSFV